MNAADAMTDDLIPPPQPVPRKRRFSLDDLLGDSRPQAVGVSDLPTAKEIRLDRIEPDPDQPRRTFDPERLEELAASIRLEGILQPVVVRYDTDRDIYVLVHGERRWRAAREAGLEVVPALVRDVPEDRRLIQQLMENIVRDDLNVLDRAAALRALKSRLGDAPWERVAQVVGIRRSRLYQLIGTEKLPESIQEDIRAGRINEKQSRSLQTLWGEYQRALRDAIVADNIEPETALLIARRLKASGVADDYGEAANEVARIRAEIAQPRTGTPAQATDVELMSLLAAIAKIEIGGTAARVALTRLADWHGFAPYDGERLLDEIYALAQTLARLPAPAAHRDVAAHEALTALRDAVAGLLEGL